MQKLSMKKMKTCSIEEAVKTEHNFSDGVYVRTVTMVADSLVLGAKHKTKHMNIISKGKVTFSIDGIMTTVESPCMFESGAGESKVLYNHDEVVWSTIHVTNETDIEILESMLADWETGQEQLDIIDEFYKELTCQWQLSQ